MKVPTFVLAAFLGAWLAIQGWELAQISALKVEVAGLTARMNYQFGYIGKQANQ